ncbi:MAG: adenosylcobinamide-GDP ribazoletransferase [Pseudomonadota bacterium]
MSELRLFLTAVQYFTRVPVPRWVGHSESQLNAAARWFPAVGIGVGLVAAAAWLAGHALISPLVGVAAALAATAWLTGAFHEDGLADTVDGLGGGYTRERALEIMKDSRIGTYGALALVLAVLVKAGALLALPAAHVATALVAGHARSRWLAVTVIATQDYVREDAGSRAKPLSHAIGGAGLAVATACGLAPLALLGPAALGGLLAAVLARAWLARLFRRRLGGYTGDCLGATQQLTEIAFYLGLAVAAGRAAGLDVFGVHAWNWR